MKGYYENPQTFLFKLPILNGLQHDTNYVNISKSMKYQTVHKVNNLIKGAVLLNNINICRNFIKRAIMELHRDHFLLVNKKQTIKNFINQ